MSSLARSAWSLHPRSAAEREGERVDLLDGSRLYLRGPPLASHSAALSIRLVMGLWVRVWCLAAHAAVIGIQNGGC